MGWQRQMSVNFKSGTTRKIFWIAWSWAFPDCANNENANPTARAKCHTKNVWGSCRNILSAEIACPWITVKNSSSHEASTGLLVNAFNYHWNSKYFKTKFITVLKTEHSSFFNAVYTYINASQRCRLNSKHCRSRSDCSMRSSLIWVCTVCSVLPVLILRTFMVKPNKECKGLLVIQSIVFFL